MPPSFLTGTSGCLVFQCSRLPCRICPPAVPAHKLLFSPALLQAACSPVICNTFFSMKTPKIFPTPPQKLLRLSGLLLGSPGRGGFPSGMSPRGAPQPSCTSHVSSLRGFMVEPAQGKCPPRASTDAPQWGHPGSSWSISLPSCSLSGSPPVPARPRAPAQSHAAAVALAGSGIIGDCLGDVPSLSSRVEMGAGKRMLGPFQDHTGSCQGR